MANYTNPTGSVTGTTGDDDFLFDQPLVSSPTVFALDGRDRLRVALPSSQGLTFSTTVMAGVFNGFVDTPPYGPRLNFFDIEDLEFVGTAHNDSFQLRFFDSFGTLTANIDAGAGEDRLLYDFSDMSAGQSFVVTDGAIASSWGQFAGFESFDIRAGTGSDTIRTGDGNDYVVSSPDQLVSTNPDTVSTGGGNDEIRAYTPGTYDGGDGIDTWNGSFVGPAGLFNTTPMAVNLGSTITISNGTTAVNVESVGVATGMGDDVFTVTRGGTIALHGGGGSDRLNLSMAIAGAQTFVVNASGSTLSGAANDLTFSDFEQVSFTGGALDDSFRVLGAFGPAQIAFDGAGGSDLLHAEFSALNGSTQFAVNADGTVTTNRGTFVSFERFELLGNAAANTFTTGAGNDSLNGGAGDDSLSGGGGNDQLSGDFGNDTLIGGAGGDVLDGDAGNDTIIAGGPADSGMPPDDLRTDIDDIHGGDGDDIVWSGLGDYAVGGAGTDTLNLSLAGAVGGAAINTTGILGPLGYIGAGIASGGVVTGTIFGFEIFARLRGSDGNDLLQIAAQPTTLVVEAGDGNDTILSMGAALDARGGAGNDELWSAAVGGVYDGGSGIDLLSFNESATAVSATLALVAGEAGTGTAGEQYRNIENVTGSIHADTLTGNNEANFLDGNLGNDVLYGLGGNDTLRGGGGVNAMTGGLGDDEYWVEDAGDQVFEAADAGFDTLYAYVSYTLQAGQHIERLELRTVVSKTRSLTGNELANELSALVGPGLLSGAGGDDVIRGSDYNDRLDGGTGADVMGGALGDDLYIVDDAGDMVLEVPGTGFDSVESSVSFTVWTTGIESLLLTGTGNIDGAGDDLANAITGNAGSNALDGRGGNDLLDGGLGADAMAGGSGDDWFIVDDAGDQVLEAAGEGYDQVTTVVSWTLGAGQHVERIALADVPGALDVTGNELDNQLSGNSAANVLTGGAGNDLLEGGAGGDTMRGGTGDDSYYVDSLADTVIELAGEGNDWLLTTISYTLTAAQSIETLQFTSAASTMAADLRGNGLANTIYGNAGVNLLHGGGGADTLYGLGGNDSYYVDNAGDVVVEVADGGTDRVSAAVSYMLGTNVHVEQLTTNNITATTAINLTGNELANQIVGNAGANVLNGGAGADLMAGVGGDDHYHVDNALDMVTEGVAEGANDRIFTSVSYALAAGVHVERLSAANSAGTDPLNLTGNALANIIDGNAGANVLDGGAGADQMAGLDGDDHYHVDNALDVVTEGAGGGTADRIFASVSYALGSAAQIEFLTTSNDAGTAAINLSGSGFAQQIVGNAGANVLNGWGGADTLVGLGGDDLYHVDNALDVVTEGAGGGTADRISASVSYTMGAGVHVEQLTTNNITVTTAINLTGNELANQIVGNAGANVLNGGAGADALFGLAGTDTFAFATAPGGGNIDATADFSVADDTIQLENAVFTGLAAGALAAGAFNTGTAATQADDRIVYNSATGALLFDADGLGGAAAMQFATLGAGLALTASDFIVI